MSGAFTANTDQDYIPDGPLTVVWAHPTLGFCKAGPFCNFGSAFTIRCNVMAVEQPTWSCIIDRKMVMVDGAMLLGGREIPTVTPSILYQEAPEWCDRLTIEDYMAKNGAPA